MNFSPIGQECAKCRYAGPKFNYNDHKCLRHAPVAEKVESWKDIRIHVPVWPIVHSDEWCGDFAKAKK